MRYSPQNTLGLVVAVVAAFTASPSIGDEVPTASVHGFAVKDVLPTHVRVRFRVGATGKSANSAMSKIVADQQVLRARLDAIKTDKPTAHIGEPFQIGKSVRRSQPNDGDNRMHRVAFEVSLVWPLKAQYATERLLRVDFVEQQLRDLELIDREDGNGSDRESNGATESSDGNGAEATYARTVAQKSQMHLDAKPTYDYIYEQSDDERAALRNAAYADAQREARDLASAAGRQLGSLRSISNVGSVSSIDILSSELASYDAEENVRFFDRDPHSRRRVTSDQLRPIQIRSDVYVVFELN